MVFLADGGTGQYGLLAGFAVAPRCIRVLRCRSRFFFEAAKEKHNPICRGCHEEIRTGTTLTILRTHLFPSQFDVFPSSAFRVLLGQRIVRVFEIEQQKRTTLTMLACLQ